MIYFFSILGFGDALITASIIEKTNNYESVTLVGTPITETTCSVMNTSVPVVRIFEHIPWVYQVKGPHFKAFLADSKKIRKFISRQVSSKDVLLFEHPSLLRASLLSGQSFQRLRPIKRQTNAYDDRVAALGVLGKSCQWDSAPILRGKVDQLLINPTARFKYKAIPPVTVKLVLQLARSLNIRTVLIDVGAEYAHLRAACDCYLGDVALATGADALRASSFYIGPDSFFSHLAYYYRIPQLGIFQKSNLYFRPPGLLESGGIFYLEDLQNRQAFEDRLGQLLTVD